MAGEAAGVRVVHSPPARLDKFSGVRITSGPTHIHSDGKTCHQCRQKNKDFGVTCTNWRNSKPCPMRLCNKCLLNRYGEKAEEVAASGDWTCPKCRGICNCSVCMKKQGHKPTGILIRTAKATGFSSVSEMLLKGAECRKDDTAAAGRIHSLEKAVDFSTRKSPNKSTFDRKVEGEMSKDVLKNSQAVKGMRCGNIDDNDSSKIKASNKRTGKKKVIEDIHECNRHNDVLSNDESCSSVCKKKCKKMKHGRSDVENDVICNQKNLKSYVQCGQKKPKKLIGVGSAKNETDSQGGYSNTVAMEFLEHHTAYSHANIQMPVGTKLNRVAGIDVLAEDAGNALQLLEFCSVFGKVLNLRKGQAENVLRDLLHGRSSRQGRYSVIAQFIGHLLSFVQDEQGQRCEMLCPSGKHSWSQVLRKCLSTSKGALKPWGLDSLEKVAETFDASQKLRVLNILCDEVLGTKTIRDWIDKQNTEHVGTVKEAKQKLVTATGKEKALKQEMQDAIGKAIIARNGTPLSKSEDSIITDIKSEVARSRASVLELKAMLLKTYEMPDAVRVEPIFRAGSGQVYWGLNCLGRSTVIRQDVGKGDSMALTEEWFALDAVEKEALEKHIRLSRGKGQRNLIQPA